jgi:hypothetical protein
MCTTAPVDCLRAESSKALEGQLESRPNVAWQIVLEGNVARSCRSEGRIRQAELHLIQQIESLKPELQRESLMDREVLDRREIILKAE